MKNKVLSSSDARRIFEHVWREGDVKVEAMAFNKRQLVSCVEYLDLEFYTYRTEIKSDKGYALIKTVGDNPIQPNNVDYSAKGATIQFLIQPFKADVLDIYIQKLRTKYSAQPIYFKLSKKEMVTVFLTIGTLKYQRQPEDEQIGRALICEVDITIQYDRSKTPIKYEIALIDNVFGDDTSQNTLYFDSQEDQQQYYESKVTADAPFVEIKAPNTGALLINGQIYYAPDTADLNILTSKNYVIIRKTDGANKEYFYYKVQGSPTVGADNEIVLNLKQDTIQTILFNPDLEIADCLIERAHLNRWIDNGDGTVSFNGNLDSPLFEQEEIRELAKRLVSRQNINLNVSDDPDIDAWVKQNILGWVYIVVDSNEPRVGGTNNNPILESTPPVSYETYSPGKERIVAHTAPYSLWAAPIINSTNNNQFQVFLPNDSVPYFWALSSFFETFGWVNASKIIDVRISPWPPFKFNSLYYSNNTLVRDFSLNANKNVLRINQYIAMGDGTNAIQWFVSFPALGNTRAAFYLMPTQQLLDYENIELSLNESFTFNKAEIVGSPRDKKFNPKLLSSNYKSLKLGYGVSSFDYDIQKLNTNKTLLNYYEALMPGITRASISITGGDIYNGTKDAYVGANVSLDTSIPYAINQLQAMLTATKNFYMQRDINTISKVGNSITGMLRGLAMPVSPEAGGEFMGAISNTVGAITERIQSNLTLDNMAAAPQTFQNVNGNVLTNLAVNRNQIFIEIWEALEHELFIADDQMFKTGFTYNRIGNIWDFINIRKYFNFLQCELDAIGGISMSNEIRNDIRAQFSTGIRFWNDDNIQYEFENYENFASKPIYYWAKADPSTLGKVPKEGDMWINSTSKPSGSGIGGGGVNIYDFTLGWIAGIPYTHIWQEGDVIVYYNSSISQWERWIYQGNSAWFNTNSVLVTALTNVNDPLVSISPSGTFYANKGEAIIFTATSNNPELVFNAFIVNGSYRSENNPMTYYTLLDTLVVVANFEEPEDP